MSIFQTKEDKVILNRLKRARDMGVTSMRVIGRGTMVVDVSELSSTEVVKKAKREAKRLIV